MKTTTMATLWRASTHWLRRAGAAQPAACSVRACRTQPTIAVAGGDGSKTRFMCAHHAVAWSESTLCRDYAQHNSAVGPTALSAWLTAG
jgi:hypothetical protein